MRKVLILAVIAVFVMMPFASFSKTAISDSELDYLIAQAGVSIQLSNITVNNVSVTAFSIGDSDGFTGYTGAGFAGLSGVNTIGNLVEFSGAINVDVGTSGSRTMLDILLPTTTIGGAAGMNVIGSLKTDSTKGLAGANAGTLGYVDIRGISIVVSGPVGVFAH